jgi:PadR family transcriptional regulator, regulatory protein AphA
MEFEAMIKVAFADAGDTDQLRAALGEIRADAEARVAEILSRSEDYANPGGPFPDRLPIVAITGKLLMGQYEAAVRWARWAEDAIAEWTGVTPATTSCGFNQQIGSIVRDGRLVRCFAPPTAAPWRF